MEKYLICFITALLTISCSNYPANVNQTLKFAGDNRAELEKVLKHYSQNETGKTTIIDTKPCLIPRIMTGTVRLQHGG